jgi:hypothetical protein
MSLPAPHPAIAQLTKDPLKSELYSREPYFREAYLDIEAVLGEDPVRTILRHGLVVVKPDGLLLGVTRTVIDFYARHGLEPVLARPVTFTPVVWRSLWTYQMTQASIDRLLINDLVIAGEGVALLFRSGDGSALPAAVALSTLKGPAKAEQQHRDCLRRAIRQPNRIFSLVHSADEPADFVRELGILFRLGERRELASVMAGRRSTEADRFLDQIRRSDAPPGRSFDYEASCKRVIDAVNQRMLSEPPIPAAHREALRRGVHRLGGGNSGQLNGRSFHLPTFLAALLATDVSVDPWDLAVSVSEIIDYDDAGASKIIDNVGAAAWQLA